MLIPLGLFGWLVMASLVALFAHHLLPTSKSRPFLDFTAACCGAMLGGVTATILGFGGLAGYDFRGLVFATLAAMLAVLLARVLRDARDSPQGS